MILSGIRSARPHSTFYEDGNWIFSFTLTFKHHTCVVATLLVSTALNIWLCRAFQVTLLISSSFSISIISILLTCWNSSPDNKGWKELEELTGLIKKSLLLSLGNAVTCAHHTTGLAARLAWNHRLLTSTPELALLGVSGQLSREPGGHLEIRGTAEPDSVLEHF